MAEYPRSCGEASPVHAVDSLHDFSRVEKGQATYHSVNWPSYTHNAVKLLEANSLELTPGEVAGNDAVVLVWKAGC